MMKIFRGIVTSCLLLTVLVLGCESARRYRVLNSINDLKDIDFGPSVPRHSLILLHWFANRVHVDDRNNVQLNFFPERGDFGSHHYSNNENLLERSWDFDYFTVGNLNEGQCHAYHDLPDYVLNPQIREYWGTSPNRARIIFRVRNNGVIDSVYLTQHYEFSENRGSAYDPQHTYEISTNLLQELRLFTIEDNPTPLWALSQRFHSYADDADQICTIMSTWGREQAHLGLLFFIVMDGWIPNHRHEPRTCRRMRRDLGLHLRDWESCDVYGMQLEVFSGKYGKAKIVWKNVPNRLLAEGVVAVLYTQQMEQKDSRVIESCDDSYDTSDYLDEGFQVRLHKAQSYLYFFTSVKEEICRGRGFPSLDPVSVTTYVKLQLFVRKGDACARLYIKEGCSEWKSKFEKSWVGFYKSEDIATADYKRNQWQWVVDFNTGPDSEFYKTFEYCSGTLAAPGVHARFILKDHEVQARTGTWP